MFVIMVLKYFYHSKDMFQITTIPLIINCLAEIQFMRLVSLNLFPARTNFYQKKIFCLFVIKENK